MDKFKCVICKKDFDGYGNNPIPIWPTGRCCDRCNAKFVIPARLSRVIKRKEK